MFEFLGLGDQSMLIFFVAFVVFTIVAYKLVKFLFKALVIGLVAAMFPVIGNMLLGLSIEISLFNMVWFAVTAMGLFVAYSAVRFVWKFLKIGFSPLKLLRRKGGKKEKEPEAKEPRDKPKPAE